MGKHKDAQQPEQPQPKTPVQRARERARELVGKIPEAGRTAVLTGFMAATVAHGAVDIAQGRTLEGGGEISVGLVAGGVETRRSQQRANTQKATTSKLNATREEAHNASRDAKKKNKKKNREIKALTGQVQTTEQELAERDTELDQQDAVITAQVKKIHELENQIARFEGFDKGADYQHQQTLDAVQGNNGFNSGNNSGYGRRGPNTQPRGGRPYRQGR